MGPVNYQLSLLSLESSERNLWFNYKQKYKILAYGFCFFLSLLPVWILVSFCSPLVSVLMLLVVAVVCVFGGGGGEGLTITFKFFSYYMHSMHRLEF